MEDRLNNSINFLRAMHLQAKETDEKSVRFDDENISILLELLKDCKKHILT